MLLLGFVTLCQYSKCPLELLSPHTLVRCNMWDQGQSQRHSAPARRWAAGRAGSKGVQRKRPGSQNGSQGDRTLSGPGEETETAQGPAPTSPKWAHHPGISDKPRISNLFLKITKFLFKNDRSKTILAR